MTFLSNLVKFLFLSFQFNLIQVILHFLFTYVSYVVCICLIFNFYLFHSIYLHIIFYSTVQFFNINYSIVMYATIFRSYLQVELVGASLTATFSEQSIQWPPYRIINRTSLTLRYKQQITPDYGISDILFPVYPSDTVQKNMQNSAVRTRANSNSNSNFNEEKENELLPWETMNPK